MDSKLSFRDHTNNICKKANQLNALAKVAPYMCCKNSYESICNISPLAWMFYSRGLNNEINSLLETALRTTYGDESSSFQDLSEKDNSVSICHTNIQTLGTEMFKVENHIAREIMKELFSA